MNKSYKMVVPRAMLERGVSESFNPITAEGVAPIFVNYKKLAQTHMG